MKVNVNLTIPREKKMNYMIFFFFDPEKYLRPDNKKIIEVLHTSSENNIPNCCTARWIISPIQDGLFWGCSRMGGGGKKTPPPPIPKVCYSYLTMMKLGYTLNSYTLPKQVPKTIWITWHTTWVLLTLTFFYRKSQILLYQERQI